MGEEVSKCKGFCSSKCGNEAIFPSEFPTRSSQKSNLSNQNPEPKESPTKLKKLKFFSGILNSSPAKDQDHDKKILKWKETSSAQQILAKFKGFMYRRKFANKLKQLFIKNETEFIKTKLLIYGSVFDDLQRRLDAVFKKKFTFQNQFERSLNTRLLIKKDEENKEIYYYGNIDIDSNFEGNGTLCTSTYKYVGEFHKNEILGYGRLYTVEGEGIEGCFEKGKINGEGIKVMIDKTIQKGKFQDSILQGEGTEETDDHYYQGSFKDGIKDGKGKVLYKLYGDKYQGDFKDNEINGFGLYIWKNNHSYQGSFLHGKMHGSGFYKWPNGDTYKGDYVNGIKEGIGEFKWSNGTRYKGPFKDGKPHGKGMMIMKGRELNVEFVNGILDPKSKKIVNDQKEAVY